MARPRKNFRYGIREDTTRGGFHVWLKLDGLPRPAHLRAKTGELLEEKVEERLRTHNPVVPLGGRSRAKTFGEFVDEWLEIQRADPDLTWATFYKDYRYKALRWKEMLGDARFHRGEVNAHRISLAKAQLLAGGRRTATVERGAGLAPASVRGFLRTLSVMLNDAVTAGLLAVNPIDSVKPIKRTVAEEKSALTVAQVRDLFARLEARPDTGDAETPTERADRLARRTRWAVAFGIGPRQGETLAFTWGDVDWERSAVRIDKQVQRRTWEHGCADPTQCGLTFAESYRAAKCPQRHGGGLVVCDPKGRKSRTVALPAALMAMLREHRAEQRKERMRVGTEWVDNDLVFCDRRGRHLDPRQDAKAWGAFLAQNELTHFGTHTARHTVITMLIDSGQDIAAVSEVAGHHAASFTERAYWHRLGEPKQRIAAAMDGILWGEDVSLSSAAGAAAPRR